MNTQFIWENKRHGAGKGHGAGKKAWRWKKRAWRWEKGAWRGAMLKGAGGNTILIAPLQRLTGQDVPFSWGPDKDKAFQDLKDSITCDDTMAFFDP